MPARALAARKRADCEAGHSPCRERRKHAKSAVAFRSAHLANHDMPAQSAAGWQHLINGSGTAGNL